MAHTVPHIASRSSFLPGLCPVSQAVEAMSEAGSEERGAVFTRREVVEFILDLSGYTRSEPLFRMRLLEPSFGEGDFLIPCVERLVDVWDRSEKRPADLKALHSAIRAVEIHRLTFTKTKARIIAILAGSGFSHAEAASLVQSWLIHGDFLLAEIDGHFDFVVGNPPYVRQENIPAALIAEYRAVYSTIYDRADLYIPFIERGLTLLRKKGRLGFICADRWMKNRYGGPLRKLVAERFHLQTYVDMYDVPAFHADVIAYPAITVIARDKPGPTRIASRPRVESEALAKLAKQLRAPRLDEHSPVKEMAGIALGAEPWILESSDQLQLVRRLEASFPTLEEAGCKVGIGVATGADKVFIGPFDELDVEADRKLPLVMTKDIQEGHVAWRGLGVINPFAKHGGLVDLKRYPKLRAYLETRKEVISRRHVAKKTPANWYRTIDRIYPEIASQPKLLIPDIKGSAHIVFENHGLYPHHNLYFITCGEWHPEALQAVLKSGIAKLFVATYSTKMRGGYLRFQAQYLRRIRVPHWRTVPLDVRAHLVEAARSLDPSSCNEAVFDLYALSAKERAAIGGSGDTQLS